MEARWNGFWRLLLVSAAIFIFNTDECSCLSAVRLAVEPPVMTSGGSVSLCCHYWLEQKAGERLYMVQFYRGHREIFRCFAASDSCKIMPMQGIYIDMSASNSTVVRLMSVQVELSGLFTCDVTAENKEGRVSVSAKASALLTVVEPPRGHVGLSVESDSRYFPGDFLRAECEAPPSKPLLDMVFLLNDFPVNSSLTVRHTGSNRLSLGIYLQSSYFGPGDQLVLKCAAQLPGGLFSMTAHADIGARPEPTPQRVTSANRALVPPCHLVAAAAVLLLARYLPLSL